ncbi:MAG: hypothetical protein QW666_03815, partial [Candidatus Woesearchaeota archaeon]
TEKETLFSVVAAMVSKDKRSTYWESRQERYFFQQDKLLMDRPIIIFIELALVIFLAYRQFRKK